LIYVDGNGHKMFMSLSTSINKTDVTRQSIGWESLGDSHGHDARFHAKGRGVFDDDNVMPQSFNKIGSRLYCRSLLSLLLLTLCIDHVATLSFPLYLEPSRKELCQRPKLLEIRFIMTDGTW